MLEIIQPTDTEIEGCQLKCTCGACPEQYDVFFEGKQIGYLRLRHGIFRADYPDCGGRTVYKTCPVGDGIFTDKEREGYLYMAVLALLSEHKEQNNV